MYTIFIMGAFFNTAKEDTAIYPEIKKEFLKKDPKINLIEPVDIENYKQDYIKSHPTTTQSQANSAMVEYDLDLIKTADLLFANLSNKSFGVGIELGIAKEYNKKIVFVCKQGVEISGMVLGAFPDVKVNYYSTPDQLYQFIKNLKLD